MLAARGRARPFLLVRSGLYCNTLCIAVCFPDAERRSRRRTPANKLVSHHPASVVQEVSPNPDRTSSSSLPPSHRTVQSMRSPALSDTNTVEPDRLPNSSRAPELCAGGVQASLAWIVCAIHTIRYGILGAWTVALCVAASVCYNMEV